MQDFTGSASPLTDAGLATFYRATGASGADLWAVLSVETSGCGYLPDKRPKMLFERHVFHTLTGGRYDHAHPDVSAASAGGYGPAGAGQYARLGKAIRLDRTSALKSASWGIGQVMGLNYSEAGYPDVEAMVAAMVASEDAQLAAMAGFLTASHLAPLLARNDWEGFALRYNGPDYARHNYDGLLRQFHWRYAAGALPDMAVRQVQVELTFRGYDPKGIDGALGPGTRAAIRSFQKRHGLAETGQVEAALIAGLG